MLNGYTDISKETVDSVFRAAEQMGYTPNGAARMLKTNRSSSLGVLFVDEMQSGLRHEYFSAMLSSLKHQFSESIRRRIHRIALFFRYHRQAGSICHLYDGKLQLRQPAITALHLFAKRSRYLGQDYASPKAIGKGIYSPLASISQWKDLY